MEHRREIKALQVGGLARDVLTPGARGTVMGVTSGGIFLHSDGKILFLTEANYDSPYNIRVESISPLAPQIAAGDAWSAEGGKIILERLDLQIDIQTAVVWEPSPLKHADNPIAEQVRRMDTLLERFRELDPDKGWLFLMDAGNGTDHGMPDLEAHRIHDLTGHFLAGVKETDLSACLESARSILGLGGGLTPSGDDWLTGFFLYFARADRQDQFLLDLGASVTAMAMERTTKISANRIEAACRGWAEEMFLEVLDHLLVSNIVLSDEKVQRLVKFGHSSGVDTCMGIHGALSIL